MTLNGKIIGLQIMTGIMTHDVVLLIRLIADHYYHCNMLDVGGENLFNKQEIDKRKQKISANCQT